MLNGSNVFWIKCFSLIFYLFLILFKKSKNNFLLLRRRKNKWLLLKGKFQCILSILYTLREKCPNTELFLVCVFPHSDWIRTRNNSVFGHFSRSAYCLSRKILSMELYSSSRYLPWKVENVSDKFFWRRTKQLLLKIILYKSILLLIKFRNLYKVYTDAGLQDKLWVNYQ